VTGFYKLLGVERTATEQEIRAAFRALAYLHPDLHPADRSATSRYQEISEAFATLSDPTRRAEYDAQPSEVAGIEAAQFALDMATEVASGIREVNPSEVAQALYAKAQTHQGRQEIRSGFELLRGLFRPAT
jgi:DnaJ-class molecular chaperone